MHLGLSCRRRRFIVLLLVGCPLFPQPGGTRKNPRNSSKFTNSPARDLNSAGMRRARWSLGGQCGRRSFPILRRSKLANRLFPSRKISA